MPITVYLADDHTMVRDGLRRILETESDISVIGDTDNGREAAREARALKPMVMVMDIAMPELNGIDTTRAVHKTCPDTRVLILSMYYTAEHIFQALQAGARGYLLKESAGKELVSAIRTVHAGNQYLSQKITGVLIDDYLHMQHTSSPLESLSPRERQILQMVVEGKSSKAIAQVLCLSPKTVETYRSRMMQKLGIADFPSLVRFAIQHGLTSPT
ncbi:MAG TPA: response regulator transcription factor [Thiohalobacter sp.]|nr:response regulator transcription factor [Thiohalobacter sp.]